MYGTFVCSGDETARLEEDPIPWFFFFLFSELSEGCLDLCFGEYLLLSADPILPKLILT